MQKRDGRPGRKMESVHTKNVRQTLVQRLGQANPAGFLTNFIALKQAKSSPAP